MPQTIILPPEAEATADGIKPGGWWHESEGHVACDLCPRACILHEGKRGFCFVRQNLQGRMVTTTYGRSTGFCIDPIEKKPLNHFYPGTSVLSFGTAGCNLGCRFCQNWEISKSREVDALGERADPETVARAAKALGCQSVAFTYNDPVVWAEYAIDCAKACRVAGIKTVAVTAGYITPLARTAFYETMDAANVDLKAFSEEFYREQTISHLAPVQETLRWLARETDVWLEVTNLVIPGKNDSDEELTRMCAWLVEALGPDVPVHFTAFHPDFRLKDVQPTPPATLANAHEIAVRAGLNYVYTGNVSDRARQSTYCPGCRQLLIGRDGYHLSAYNLDQNRCRHCGKTIAGRFGDAPGDWGPRRQAVRIAKYCEVKFGAANKDSPIVVTEKRAVEQFGLTADQERLVFAVAARRLFAEVLGEPAASVELELAGLAAKTGEGVFVTLKRAGVLRSCCGSMGEDVPLAMTLERAVVAAAKHDHRFPPISPVELPYLEMHVTLLGGNERVTARGVDRVNAVIVGKHGLKIARGRYQGLLLPVVAVEHHLDAENFLKQVCHKAGLPPTAWQDDDTLLTTFQGHAIEGDTKTAWDAYRSRAEAATSPGPGQSDLAPLVDFCRRNLNAMLLGATPAYYSLDASDGGVQGVVLSLQLPGRADRIDCSQINVQGELPLQSTLLDLTQAAASLLQRNRVQPAAVSAATIDLTVLRDVAMHGTISDPQLQGVEPSQRALFVVYHDRWALAWDPRAASQELLREAVELLRLPGKSNAAVFSLAAVSTADRIAATNVAKPQRGDNVRMPAYAGSFYPRNAEEIRRTLDGWLKGRPEQERWTAALVPHAGWVYSGRLAADVFRRIAFPKQVIVLAPRHGPEGADWAVAPHAVWQLPGTWLGSDPALAAALAQAVQGLELDAAAHAHEHAIEVQLPMIARLAPQARVVGITIRAGRLDDLRRFGEQLAGAITGLDERPLLVISSDMNHYADERETRRHDHMALEALESLDPERLYRTVHDNHISMCGVLPAVVVLSALRHLNALNRCQRVGYTTSAEASHDEWRCVGYAGLLFA